MPVPEPPTNFDIWKLLGTFAVTVVSATVSILSRIVSGHKATCLWVITEYLTAILFAYLVYHAYPTLAPLLPEWVTLPVLVAIAAHSGGKFFKALESAFLERITTLIKLK
jgi:hypothetical protein